jgi:hypothetical protein
MAGKSFYELDYIIEINEQRLEQYTEACDKVSERLTNIIVIYSAMAIFLVPIVRMIFYAGAKPWWLNGCFVLFAVLFLVSVVNTVRLILPANLTLLKKPKLYYDGYRLQYEEVINNRMSVEVLLKASYIRELEDSIHANYLIYKRKSTFYSNALISVLLSIMPYLICFGNHISNQENDKEQNMEIVKKDKNVF